MKAIGLILMCAYAYIMIQGIYISIKSKSEMKIKKYMGTKKM